MQRCPPSLSVLKVDDFSGENYAQKVLQTFELLVKIGKVDSLGVKLNLGLLLNEDP